MSKAETGRKLGLSHLTLGQAVNAKETEIQKTIMEY